MQDHTIIYSHGFGVQKDSRGMFTEIAESLPGPTHIMFNYDTFDPATNTCTVSSLDANIQLFQQNVTTAQESSQKVSVIAHSMGCIVAALSQVLPDNLILLAPPTVAGSPQQKIDSYLSRNGTKLLEDGSVSILRKDGTTTVVPAAYWDSWVLFESSDMVAKFNEIANQTNLTIVKASQDEILGDTDFSGLSPKINLIQIPTDHNFKTTRQELTITIHQILGQKT